MRGKGESLCRWKSSRVTESRGVWCVACGMCSRPHGPHWATSVCCEGDKRRQWRSLSCSFSADNALYEHWWSQCPPSRQRGKVAATAGGCGTKPSHHSGIETPLLILWAICRRGGRAHIISDTSVSASWYASLSLGQPGVSPKARDPFASMRCS